MTTNPKSLSTATLKGVHALLTQRLRGLPQRGPIARIVFFPTRELRKAVAAELEGRGVSVIRRRAKKPLRERFAALVGPVQANGCRLWLGGANDRGYGQLYTGGRMRKASQIAWELHHGKQFPDGMEAAHVVCDDPRCVNPLHIQPLPHKDNMKDMVVKNRSAHGGRSPRADFTEAKVRQIRRLLNAGQSQTEVAELFNLSQQSIWSIHHRRTWRRVAA